MNKALLGTLVLFSAVAQPLVGQDENKANHWASLVGLKRIVVQVGMFGDTDGSGLTQDPLQTAAELELRRADIPAYPLTDTLDLRRWPVLDVLITLNCDKEHLDGACTYLIAAELYEYVMLARPPGASVFASTWQTRPNFGVVGRENVRRMVQDEVRDMMDRFANAYLAANLKH